MDAMKPKPGLASTCSVIKTYSLNQVGSLESVNRRPSDGVGDTVGNLEQQRMDQIGSEDPGDKFFKKEFNHLAQIEWCV